MAELQRSPDKIRNIAIIAHVDHGKTTLVDHLLKQSGMFRDNEKLDDRVMDSMDLERERGITIAAKNTAVFYKDYKINIVDTPGHSDFGGEVERVLNMVDGAILLVDASEGPLPQTRFVLQKALAQNIKIFVCINKIDRKDARIQEVRNEIFDLFIDLNAPEEQADYDCLYAIAREGMVTLDPDNIPEQKSMEVMYQWIIEKLPPPKADLEGPLQIMVSNIGYNAFVGRLGIGRVRQGSVRVGEEVLLSRESDNKKGRVTALFLYDGLKQVPVNEVSAGDIAVVAGFEEFNIGDTVTSVTNPSPLPRLKVDEPTVEITISVNDGPFAGKEGKHVTSRKILERLEKELLTNVAIRMIPTDRPEVWRLLGRGELQLAVLAEQMRREGFEFILGKPQVLFRKDGDTLMEPMEKVYIDIPDVYTGIVSEKLGPRKGVMMNMNPILGGRMRLEFLIPSRGLIGYRSEFLTDTKGMGLLNREFAGYEPFKGDIAHRQNGAMVADRAGKATPYAIFHLEDRGRFFINAGIDVYEGMIVGEHAKDNDLWVNIIREKKLTNVRASGSDEAIRLTPVKPLTIEQAMEWIRDQEMIEITPLNVRMRMKDLKQN
ncbi:MAG: translational GTPase TypA [Bdellovibrionaceae bacterium]|nr:translational GTPase TypA [Pseudobdellovibrionaceae bacterium]